MLQPFRDLALLTPILRSASSFLKIINKWASGQRKKQNIVSLSLQIFQTCLSTVKHEGVLKEEVVEGIRKCLRSADLSLESKEPSFLPFVLFTCFVFTFLGLFVIYFYWRVFLFFNPPTVLPGLDRFFFDTFQLFTLIRPDSADDQSSEFLLDSSAEELFGVESFSDQVTSNDIYNNICTDEASLLHSQDLESPKISNIESGSVGSSDNDSGFLMQSGDSTKINSTESDVEACTKNKKPLETNVSQSVNTTCKPSTAPSEDANSLPSQLKQNSEPRSEVAKLSFDITTEEGRAAMRLFVKKRMATQASAATGITGA